MQQSTIQILSCVAQQLFKNGQFELAAQQCDIAANVTNYADPTILLNSADCYYQAGQFAMAAARTKKFIDLTKSDRLITDLQPHYQQLAAYLRLAGEYPAAREVLRQILGTPPVLLLQGWFAMQQGNFKESVQLTAQGRGNAYWAANRKIPSGLQWTSPQQNIKNLRILVCGEGGCGDEIIFARWLAELKIQCRTVVYYTDNSLGAVFARQFDIDCVADPDCAEYDLWVPAMQLAYLLDCNTPDSATYLTADASAVEYWKTQLPPTIKKRVVVNWTGNLDHPENKFRSIPLELLLEQIGTDVQLINIQKNHKQVLPSTFVDLSPQITDWNDTLAILSLCDLTITCCTSIAHASAALGKKTAVLVNHADYFTWCNVESGKKSEWYSDTWVFRQVNNQWAPAIRQSMKLYSS